MLIYVWVCVICCSLICTLDQNDLTLQCSSDISKLRIRVLYERILRIRVSRMSIRAHIRVYTHTYTRIYARICLFVMHSHKFLYVKHC